MEPLRSLYLAVRRPKKLPDGYHEFATHASDLGNERGLLDRFIASAQNLHVLRLEFLKTKHRYRYPLRYILGRTTFPQLRWIWLKKAVATRDELVSFSKRHKELMHIRLDEFASSRGSFEDTLKELSQSLPNVRRFEIRGRMYAIRRGIGQPGVIQEWMCCPDEVAYCQHLRCHALDNYIRNGGVMPVTEENIATHVPSPTYKGQPGQGPAGEVDYPEDRIAAAKADADKLGEGTEWRKGWV